MDGLVVMMLTGLPAPLVAGAELAPIKLTLVVSN
tara:strand:+ start:2568 stop:2669 length:102 start_codon:yes stop_codon:yes gene_type:complete